MQCLALNATPVSMTCYRIERTFPAGYARCLVGPDGTRDEGQFCITLAPKHVCLHANATVIGLLPGKGESLVRSIGDLIAAAAAASALVTALTKFKELPSSVRAVTRAKAGAFVCRLTCFGASVIQKWPSSHVPSG